MIIVSSFQIGVLWTGFILFLLVVLLFLSLKTIRLLKFKLNDRKSKTLTIQKGGVDILITAYRLDQLTFSNLEQLKEELEQSSNDYVNKELLSLVEDEIKRRNKYYYKL